MTTLAFLHEYVYLSEGEGTFFAMCTRGGEAEDTFFACCVHLIRTKVEGI